MEAIFFYIVISKKKKKKLSVCSGVPEEISTVSRDLLKSAIKIREI